MIRQKSKILIDNNLSVRLKDILISDFPGTVHVADLRLADALDTQLWQLARDEHFTIMTKDKDFYHRVSTLGPPPTVIWITRGNCSNQEMLSLVEHHITTIRSFLASSQALLIIP